MTVVGGTTGASATPALVCNTFGTAPRAVVDGDPRVFAWGPSS
jgi:hypothetical protein